jgi:hypothetical protein
MFRAPANAPPRPLHPARSKRSVPLQPLDLCPMFHCSTPTPHSRAALRFSTPAHCRLSLSLPWCRPGSHRTRCTPFLLLPVKTRGSLPARSLVLLCCGGRRTGRPKGCSRFSRSPRALCCPCACYLLLSCCGWRARTKGTAPPRSPRPSRWPRCPKGRAPPPRSRGSGRVRLRCPRREPPTRRPAIAKCPCPQGRAKRRVTSPDIVDPTSPRPDPHPLASPTSPALEPTPPASLLYCPNHTFLNWYFTY